MADSGGDSSLIPQNVNLSLVLLMGLPASGKTSLANKIKLEYSDKNCTCLISYDDFVSHETQAMLPSLAKSSVAKNLRKNFVESIRFIVSEVNSSNSYETDNSKRLKDFEDKLIRNEEMGEVISRYIFVEKVRDILTMVIQSSKGNVMSEFIFIIDDNNYYTSMRNEFYNIAKTYCTGFCILYCKTSLRSCRKRNSDRDEKFKVPDKTIVEMSLKLEEPNMMTNPCDAFSIQITECEELSNEVDQDNIPLIIQVIQNSMKNPIQWNPQPDRRHDIEREQRICSESEIHQADLILRKWINKELTLSSLMKPSAESSSKRKYSKELNKRKSLVLAKLKNGELKLLAEITDDLEFREEVITLANIITLE